MATRGWNPLNREYWSGLSLTEREDICARAGWVTKQAKHTGCGWIGGNITPMGKRIAKTSWDKLSDAAQVVLLRFGEYLREDGEHNPVHPVSAKIIQGVRGDYHIDPVKTQSGKRRHFVSFHGVGMRAGIYDEVGVAGTIAAAKDMIKKHMKRLAKANPATYIPDHPEVGKAGTRYLKAVSAGADPVISFRKEYDKIYGYISHTDFLKYISSLTPKRPMGSTPAYLGGATPGVNPKFRGTPFKDLPIGSIFTLRDVTTWPKNWRDIREALEPMIKISDRRFKSPDGRVFNIQRVTTRTFTEGLDGKNVGKKVNKNSGVHALTYGSRKSATGSGNYYPVVNNTPYYTRTFRSGKAAENEAKRMAQASKKELESGGYKVSVKKENCPSGVRCNWSNPPPPGATKIYDNVLALEAKKGSSSLWPGEEFRHDFKAVKGKASVYGLPDGSLLIKGNKRLWKKFNYPHGAGN